MKFFSPFPGLQIVYSHKTDGGFRTQEAVAKAIASYTDSAVTYLQLEHGHHIVPLNQLLNGTTIGDAMLTNVQQQVLSFVVADCYSVVFFHQEHHAVGLLHCGWKSLAQNLIALTLEEMHNTYGTVIEELLVWIGPGICEQCYLQDQEPEQMNKSEWKECIQEIEHKKYSIDLRKFIQSELQKAGVSDSKIKSELLCTYESANDLFSHRKATQKGDEDGRFLVAAWTDFNI